MFWTVPLQSGREDEGQGGVRVDLEDGKARMRAKNLRVRDFFNIPNALFRFQSPASVRATVSFDIRWLGPATGRSAVTSPPGSSGRLLMSPVTMRWSAQNAQGFSFKSNPSGTTSVFGQLGRVRNGIFCIERAGYILIHRLSEATRPHPRCHSSPRPEATIAGPGSAKTVDELLAQARATLPDRPSPAEALRAQASGALLIDIRGDDQRRETA